jgi:ribonuclease BN (tRNA processing enzyme)
MRVTVLGSSASFAPAGKACSGYLVEGGGVRVLLDCGNGVLANLTSVMDPLELDAIVVSHAHPDHFADLYALQALLRYAPSGPAPAKALYAPHGLFERLKVLLSGRGAIELEEAFAVTELAHGRTIQLGKLEITPLLVEHTEPTFGVRVREGDAVFAYTADTAPGDWLHPLLDHASLAFAEATLPEEYAGAAPHLTAGQAGRAAREARVEDLVLTHLWPTNDFDRALAQATEAFGAPVRIASEFDTFDVS